MPSLRREVVGLLGTLIGLTLYLALGVTWPAHLVLRETAQLQDQIASISVGVPVGLSAEDLRGLEYRSRIALLFEFGTPVSQAQHVRALEALSHLAGADWETESLFLAKEDVSWLKEQAAQRADAVMDTDGPADTVLAATARMRFGGARDAPPHAREWLILALLAEGQNLPDVIEARLSRLAPVEQAEARAALLAARLARDDASEGDEFADLGEWSVAVARGFEGPEHDSPVELTKFAEHDSISATLYDQLVMDLWRLSRSPDPFEAARGAVQLDVLGSVLSPGTSEPRYDVFHCASAELSARILSEVRLRQDALASMAGSAQHMIALRRARELEEIGEALKRRGQREPRTAGQRDKRVLAALQEELAGKRSADLATPEQVRQAANAFTLQEIADLLERIPARVRELRRGAFAERAQRLLVMEEILKVSAEGRAGVDPSLGRRLKAALKDPDGLRTKFADALERELLARSPGLNVSARQRAKLTSKDWAPRPPEPDRVEVVAVRPPEARTPVNTSARRAPIDEAVILEGARLLANWDPYSNEIVNANSSKERVALAEVSIQSVFPEARTPVNTSARRAHIGEAVILEGVSLLANWDLYSNEIVNANSSKERVALAEVSIQSVFPEARTPVNTSARRAPIDEIDEDVITVAARLLANWDPNSYDMTDDERFEALTALANGRDRSLLFDDVTEKLSARQSEDYRREFEEADERGRAAIALCMLYALERRSGEEDLFLHNMRYKPVYYSKAPQPATFGLDPAFFGGTSATNRGVVSPPPVRSGAPASPSVAPFH